MLGALQNWFDAPTCTSNHKEENDEEAEGRMSSNEEEAAPTRAGAQAARKNKDDEASERVGQAEEEEAQADGAAVAGGAPSPGRVTGAPAAAPAAAPASAIIVQPMAFAARVDDPEYTNAVHQARMATQVANELAAAIVKASAVLNAVADRGAVFSPITIAASGTAVAGADAAGAAGPTVVAPLAVASSGVQAADDFELVLLKSTHWGGQLLVPGGEAQATRLGTTSSSHSIFPHVLAMTEQEGGAEGDSTVSGTLFYSVQTDKNVSIRVRMHRKSERGNAPRAIVDEKQLIDILNTTRTDPDEPRVTGLQFRMELYFDSLDEHGKLSVPIGAGTDMTFERSVVNHRSGNAQLLSPPEQFDTCPHYTADMRSGTLDWHFRFQSGCVSHMTIPRKRSFIIVVRCTHPRLEHLTVTSPPFQTSSKFAFCGKTLERGEMYTENPIAGGRPVRVKFRKRTRAAQA
jgi:hypothetical protein